MIGDVMQHSTRPFFPFSFFLLRVGMAVWRRGIKDWYVEHGAEEPARVCGDGSGEVRNFDQES